MKIPRSADERDRRIRTARVSSVLDRRTNGMAWLRSPSMPRGAKQRFLLARPEDHQVLPWHQIKQLAAHPHHIGERPLKRLPGAVERVMADMVAIDAVVQVRSIQVEPHELPPQRLRQKGIAGAAVAHEKSPRLNPVSRCRIDAAIGRDVAALVRLAPMGYPGSGRAPDLLCQQRREGRR